MPSQDEINAQLKVLLGEDLKVISYKWVARHFGISCNLAKQALFAFLEKHRGKVKATYLLAGWTAGEQRQHVVQLVDSEQLTTSRSALDPVTSMHVYSLQPTQPKDASELWNHDAIQTSELFQQLRLGKVNCLADNRWSAVKSSEAKHDPNLAKRTPKPTAGASDAEVAPGPSKAPQKKPAAKLAAAQIAGIMAGSTANKDGVAAASVAVRGSGSSSVRDCTEAPMQERESGTTATAPAAAAPLSAATAPAATAPGGKKKGGSRLANMWSKAPAVKEQDKPKQAAGGKAGKSKAAAAPAVDADAALRSAQQASSSNDSDEDEGFLPVKRGALQRSRRIEEEDEEEEEDVPVKAPAKRARKAPSAAATPSGRSVIVESENDEEGSAEPKQQPPREGAAKDQAKKAAAKQKPAKKPAKSPAKKAASKAAQSDDDMNEADLEVSLGEEEDQPHAEAEVVARGKSKGKRAAAAPAPAKAGKVKAGAASDGVKRRKVMQTVINDRGEEVTEEVWEDSQQASPQPENSPRAASEQPQASPSQPSPAKASQEDALKEQPGNGVATAGKQAAGKPSKPGKASTAAGKKASGKAASKDQRGIMSFFAKK